VLLGRESENDVVIIGQCWWVDRWRWQSVSWYRLHQLQHALSVRPLRM